MGKMNELSMLVEELKSVEKRLSVFRKAWLIYSAVRRKKKSNL